AATGLGGALAGLINPVSLGLTGALAGYGLTQFAGEELQGYKNMGSIRGGGAMQGMGYEMSIRAMAMDPFLTTEQSRQVIQSALSEGYTGQTFDTVTKFIASNIKEMNMSVNDSVKLLRTNVNEGGESIAGLASSLAVLKEASKTGATSLPELQASYASGTEAMIKGGGISGPQASQAMLTLNDVWKGDQTLKLKAGEIVSGLSTSPQGQMAAFTLSGTPLPPGALPGTLFERSGDGGRAATFGMLKRIAQMAQQGSGGDEANGAWLFQMYLQRIANIQLDRAEARKMYLDLISGRDPLAEGEKEAKKDVQNATKTQGRSFWESLGGTFQDFGKGAGRDIIEGGKALFKGSEAIFSGQDVPGAIDQFGKFWSGLNRVEKGGHYHSTIMDSIVAQYGPKGIEVLDENNKAMTLDQNNKGQMQALSEG
ncbi:MAG TPA: hypothetical protein PK181_08955, partial [Methanothrix soehngenii]|nr:hypothetical protein [Methanothrix soehngenii]